VDVNLPGVTDAVRPVLSKAVDQGAGSGKAILRHRKGMHAKTDVDFQALADNTLADAAAAILAARERFADELQRSTERMAGQGMDTDAILDVLRLDWAKQSRGRISGVLWSWRSDTVSRSMPTKPSPDEYFLWVTVANGNVCPECLLIESMQPEEGRTLEEWISRGLPGSGHTACGDHCHCALIEAEYIRQEGIDPKFIYIKSGEIAEAPPAVKDLWALFKAGRLAGMTEEEMTAAMFGETSLKGMAEALDRVIIQRPGGAAAIEKARAEISGNE